MKNIIFSYPTRIENELDRVGELLLDSELDFFHLRKPDFDYNQMKEYLNEINDHLHCKIIIHSHYSLISDFDLAGINLNKKGLSQLAYADEVDKCFIQPLVLKNSDIEVNREMPNMVTYSGHSIGEINELPFNVEYAFLSPIFDSISKGNYPSNFDLKEVKEDLKKVKVKIIALGGVTLSHVEDLQEAGFDGCARLGDFWKINKNLSA